MDECGIVLLSELKPHVAGSEPTKIRRLLRDYKLQHVTPRAEAVADRSWYDSPVNRKYIEQHGGDRWRVYDIDIAGAPIGWIRAWSRLRLQGAFQRSATGTPHYCRLCVNGLETDVHLLTECTRGRALAEDWAWKHSMQLPQPGGARLHYVLGGGPRDQQRSIAGLVVKIHSECVRSRRVPVWPAPAQEACAGALVSDSSPSSSSEDGTLYAPSASDGERPNP